MVPVTVGGTSYIQGVATDLLYGLDIETDTTIDGLDPRVAPVVAVALATPDTTTVFTGDEATILRDLDRAVAGLPAGVIVTWNGAAFDLPFLADRARACGVTLGLALTADPSLGVRPDPLPGHAGAYRARWGVHRHLDAYRVYRADVGASLGLSCALKAVARLVGLEPVEVDRSDISGLAPDELVAYVASDADVTRRLVLRRWPACGAGIDAAAG
jgi:uncharacterized protein YprB with RNaseH-like and TPR domain